MIDGAIILEGVHVQYREQGCRNALNRRDAEPIRAEVATLRATHGIADRRREPLAHASDPEQLSLAV